MANRNAVALCCLWHVVAPVDERHPPKGSESLTRYREVPKLLPLRKEAECTSAALPQHRPEYILAYPLSHMTDFDQAQPVSRLCHALRTTCNAIQGD